MSTTRFLKNVSLFVHQKHYLESIKPFKSFLNVKPTMSSAITISQHSIVLFPMPKINVVDVMNNLNSLVTTFQISNDDVVKMDVNRIAVDCLQRSLGIAKNTYNMKKYSAARTQLSVLALSLEKIYGNTSLADSDSSDLKKFAFEVYTMQGMAFKRGTLEQSGIALKAFEKALQLEPNNQKAKYNYEELYAGLNSLEFMEEKKFKP